MSNNRRTIIFISSWTCWSILGFARGIKSYDYKNTVNYGKNRKPYMYSERIGCGFIGFFVYACPLLIIPNLFKEIHRFEVNVRGLEEQKKTSYYNEL